MPYKNKKQQKEQSEKYYQKNKEHLKEYQKKCRKDHVALQKDYYKNQYQKYKKQGKIYKLKKLYNLTLEEIDQMATTQNHKCILCGKSLMETKRCTDHDYETGKVRGILCDNCNMGLGHFHDNPELLRKAAIYVETNKLK